MHLSIDTKAFSKVVLVCNTCLPVCGFHCMHDLELTNSSLHENILLSWLTLHCNVALCVMVTTP